MGRISLFSMFHHVKMPLKLRKNPILSSKMYNYVVYKFIQKEFRGGQWANPPEARHFLMFHYVKRALKSGKIQYFYQIFIHMQCEKITVSEVGGPGPFNPP